MINEQIQQFEKKRELLASLVRVAQDLNGHTHALHDVQLLAKPSQAFPAKVNHYKEELSRSTQTMDDVQLLKRSERFDKQTTHLLEALLEFIDIVQHQVELDKEPTEFGDEVRLQLDEFKNVSHMAVGLRLCLQDLGVFLPALKIGFPQEWIGEQIDAMNETNHLLRVKSKDRIAELIYEAEQILTNSQLAEATRDALAYAQHAMKLDLEFLEHGGSIEQLPHDLEELELNTLPQGSVEEFKEATERQVPVLTDMVTDHEAKLSFNKKLKLWLNTPWSTRWRDLE